MHLGYAFRGLPHPRARAVLAGPAGLRPRARGVLRHRRRDGGRHGARLELRRRPPPRRAAASPRSRSAATSTPGEVRVVILEAQPFHSSTQRLPARRRRDRRARARVRRGRGHGRPASRPTTTCPSTSPQRPRPRDQRDRSTPSSSAPAPTGWPPPSRSPRPGSRSPCSRAPTPSVAAPAPRSSPCPASLHDLCSAVHPFGVGLAVPLLAAAGRARAGLALARGRPGPPARRRLGGRDGPLARRHLRRARGRRARPGGGVFAPLVARLRRARRRTCSGPVLRLARATRSRMARFGLRAGAAGDRAGPRFRTPQARALFAGYGGARLPPAQPAQHRLGGAAADRGRPPARLAGRRGRLGRHHRPRWPRCWSRSAAPS